LDCVNGDGCGNPHHYRRVVGMVGVR
jgi:hypothetical protein